MKTLQLQGALFDVPSIQCALGNTHAKHGINIQSMNQYFWVGIASLFIEHSLCRKCSDIASAFAGNT